MSSNALRTVLFPDPERPVRTTSCRPLALFLVLREWRAWRFTVLTGLTLHSALVCAGDPHVFPVFRHRPPCYLDSVFFELLRNLLVGERLRGVFLIDHLLHQPLQGQQRHPATFRPVHRL